MGRYKFRLSDMIPNAWFYKLRDMGARAKKATHHRPTSQKPCPPPPAPSPVPKNAGINPGRASYYIPRSDGGDSPAHPKASDTKFLLADPPRRSRRKPRTPKVPSAKLVRSSVSSHCSCRASLGSMWRAGGSVADQCPPLPPLSPVSYDDDDDISVMPSEKPIVAEHSGGSCSSCSSRITTSPPGSSSNSKSSTDVAGEVDLPPILTKPPKRDVGAPNGRARPPQQGRRCPEGLRLRGSSPRLAKLQGQRCRGARGTAAAAVAATPRKGGLSGSFAVVKASSDPRRDFTESMVEMIVENNIRSSKELEDLLACYLSLNSREYHDMIVKVFEQIWFDLSTNVRL